MRFFVDSGTNVSVYSVWKQQKGAAKLLQFCVAQGTVPNGSLF